MSPGAGSPPEAGAPPLAIVLKGWPRLSETFIAQELKALEDRGFRFEIWSLRRPYDDRTHPIHGEVRARVRYLPEYLYEAPLRVLRAWRKARLLPGYRAARALWLRDLARDRTPNRVRRWGQALVMAAEAPEAARLHYAHFLHTPASVARYAAILRGVGWAVSAHAKDIWTTPDWEAREKLAECRFAVTCTASGASRLAALAPAPGRVRLVYHGLDLSRFPAPPEPRPARDGLDEGRGEPFAILSVGRLVEKKGYDDLIAALALLPASLDWRFVHVGGGPLGETLKREAARLGLSGRIEWRGKRDQVEVIDALRAADLFVLPSKIAGDGDRDGLPNVLMEAASQKLPILSTAVSAIPEFVEDGVHGRLVPPDDPAALAAAIEALARDVQKRIALADAAHARLRAEFGMAGGVAVLEKLLRDALGASGAPGASVAPAPEAAGRAA